MMNIELLKNWFKVNKRDLPWRKNITPYSVWVSEVMLQQTQVATVIPYFEKWMLKFPTIESLAKADLDDVIKLWEGLGYYSRARALHEGAKKIVQEYNGIIPNCQKELYKIKGLGPYTVGAICSFAFKQKIEAVDGNVLRVLSRYFLIEEDILKLKTLKEIRKKAFEILPENEPWIVNEALIELGATVCSKKPNCQKCPLKSSCKGYHSGKAEELPFKSKSTKIEKIERNVAIIMWQDEVFIKRCQKDEIMKDLHEFPFFETKTSELAFFAAFDSEVKLLKILSQEKHSFTRFQVTLFPRLYKSEKKASLNGYQWVKIEEVKNLAFSAGHKRVLHTFLGFNF